MDEFFDQFFPTEFLIEYLENGPVTDKKAAQNVPRLLLCIVFSLLRQRKIRLL